jgi:hypothetical protein
MVNVMQEIEVKTFPSKDDSDVQADKEKGDLRVISPLWGGFKSPQSTSPNPYHFALGSSFPSCSCLATAALSLFWATYSSACAKVRLDPSGRKFQTLGFGNRSHRRFIVSSSANKFGKLENDLGKILKKAF